MGDLGFVEMTQALVLEDAAWCQVGPDMLLQGYLPQSGGLRGLAAATSGPGPLPPDGRGSGAEASGSSSGSGAGASSSGSSSGGGSGRRGRGRAVAATPVAEFYKSWDRYGALSNFSPHPITMPAGPMTPDRAAAAQQAQQQQAQQQQQSGGGASRLWPSTEHYYQSQKFEGAAHPEAAPLVEAIAAAGSPEEAAALGRRAERQRPELLRGDWGEETKLAVMGAALAAKFGGHEGPRRMLLSTATAAVPQQQGRSSGGGMVLVEGAPHDFFWGRGYDGSGRNLLGKLLMELRDELLQQQGGSAA